MPYAWVRAGVLFALCGLDFSIAIYNRYFNEDYNGMRASVPQW